MSKEVINIESPSVKELFSPRLFELSIEHSDTFKEAMLRTEAPEYLHWTKLKFKSWIPDCVTPEEFWALIKLIRRSGSRLVISDMSGKHFTWKKLAHYDKQLHELDLHTGGRLVDSHTITDEQKKIFVSRGILEEAIASAQMEGAHTTRDVAKKMLEEGRQPQNQGQRMVLNNYHTMLKIEEEIKDRPINLDLLFDLHRMLTEGTLDDPSQVGRLRRDDEDIYVGSDDGKIAYVPPPMSFVQKEIGRLISYANDEVEGKNDEFLHPVIKAISLHFWIGFLHPFADGNGRLARAIFYWYLLRKGYWTFAFIPVSTRIKQSPIQYARSYIYSEQDDNDLTYFIDYNLRKIELARRDFLKFIDRKSMEQADFGDLSKKFPTLNHRQLSLVKYLRACPRERTNVTAMTKIYGVSEMTAINDLKALMNGGFLTRRRMGRNVFYYPTSKLLG